MPVRFLSKEHIAQYGRYTDPPSPPQLARYFYFDQTDLNHINQRYTDHTRLGYAIQLGTVRFLGTFVSDLAEVPPEVISHLAGQLSIKDATVWQHYTGSKTQRRHTEEIKQQYGYLDFHHSLLPFGLLRRLYARAWLGPERPIVLFNFAVSWLIEHKILLPGVTVLERLVAQVRDRANRRLWRRLATLPNPTQKENLQDLLKIEADKRQSALDRLRRAPTRISSAAMVRALQRLEEVRQIGVGGLDLSHLPAGRVRALARYATVAWAKTMDELQEDRKIATLLAFAHELEAIAQDDALDLLDQLTNEKFKLAVKSGQQERLQTLADFDLATDHLRAACLILLDEELPEAEVRQTIFEQVSRQELLEATDLLGRRKQMCPRIG